MTDMTTDSAPEAAVEASSEPTAVPRPEYLPEKFWNTESSQPNVEGLAKSYTELERKFSQRASALREELEKEILAPREGVPESPDKYQYAVPSIENLPNGWEAQMADDDPMLGWWRETAHSRGLTQDEFQEGINKYFEYHFGGLPNREAELQNLGENGQARVDAVDMWLGKNLTEQEYNVIAEFAVNADSIKVLEKIIGIQAEPSLSSFEGAPSTGSVNEDKLREMMDDPRYWKPGQIDDAYRSQVTKAWQKHFG